MVSSAIWLPPIYFDSYFSDQFNRICSWSKLNGTVQFQQLISPSGEFVHFLQLVTSMTVFLLIFSHEVQR
jgi:hypothetical protein